MKLIRLSALAFLSLTLLGSLGGSLYGDDTGTPGMSTHRMAGIGVKVGNDNGPKSGAGWDEKQVRDHLVINGVLPDSPAEKVGLKTGDKIVAIDDAKVAGLKFNYAVNTLLRGEAGTPVKITVVRPGQSGRLTFVPVRTILPDPEKH